MKNQLPLVALVAGLSVSSVSAQVLSQWTFETTQPSLTATAGQWITNLTAEAGLTPGVASGLHATAATYSNPAGNGSVESFSVNGWSSGDFFQFVLTTIGHVGITVSFDQAGSGTGPRDFRLTYGTDGVNFTPAGDYAVLLNGAPNSAWSSGTHQPAFNYFFDLSDVSALDNANTVYFRLENISTVSINNATVAAAGTGRVDNFIVAVVPEPSVLALGGLGLMALWAVRRRARG